MPDDTVIVAGGTPGQIEIKEGGKAQELTLPLGQWRALLVVRLLLVISCGALFLVWAPWSFLALGIIVIALLLIVQVGREEGVWFVEARRGQDATAQVARAFVVACALIAWALMWDDLLMLTWPETLDLYFFTVPLRFMWKIHVAVRLALSVPSAVLVWCYPELAWRLRAEIADSNWPPTIAPRLPDTGPAFPHADVRSSLEEAIAPPPRTERIVVEETERERGMLRSMINRLVLEGSDAPEKVRQMAQLVVDDGMSFSEPEMAGRGPLTGPEFRRMRDDFLDWGWAAWRNPDNHREGVELTAAGWHVLRALAQGNGRSPHPTEKRSLVVPGILRE